MNFCGCLATFWSSKEIMDDDQFDLHKDNLLTFLNDNIFVEYFNSFLLLPTFSCHVFYDLHLEVFQPVQEGPSSCWTPEDHGLLSSCSASTIYLTQSRLGQFSDPALCQEWIINNRLPLFLKSELFSEYKLVKILSNSASAFFAKCIQQAKEKSHSVQSAVRPLSRRKKHSLPARISSDKTARRLSARSSRLRPLSSSTGSEELDKIETKINFLQSKSGMEGFKKFLNGKLGETSLMFWVGVESLKNVEHESELTSGLKELLYKYPEIDEVKVIFSQVLEKNQRMKTIKEIQYKSLRCLKDYWYPRFLINFLSESRLSLPSIKLCQTLMDDSLSNTVITNSPLKSFTPTFRKIPKTKSSHQFYTASHHSMVSRNITTSSTPHLDNSPPTDRSRSRNESSASRLIWSRDSARDTVSDQSVERSSRLATYNKYPLVPCGRTSSMSIDQTTTASRTVTPLHPPTCPQILSVCGTPVPLDEYQQKRADYRSLLNCLSLEKRKAGGYFQKHLELLSDTMHINLLLFWREVQEYKGLFLKYSFSITSVEMKAKVICGKYIVEGSLQSIHCPLDIAMSIFERVWPAFEDLFDEAEEYTLSLLIVQWKELCILDHQSFENLQRTEQIESFSKMSFTELEKLSEECDGSYSSVTSGSDELCYTVDDDIDYNSQHELLQQSSSVRHLSNTDRTGTLQDTTTDGSSRALIRDEEMLAKKEMTFSDILKNSRELEYFKTYLNDNNGAIHLMCWMEIESYRALPAGEKVVRNMKAKHIRDKYFTKKYFFGPQSPVTIDLQRQVVSVGGSQRLPSRPKSAVFREAQKHIRSKIEKFVRLFVRTKEFLERTVGQSTIKNGKKEEMVLDNSHSQHTESDETILLRKVLSNEEERKLFQYFIDAQAAEGTCPARQVDFWLEVQRYKNMFHSQMNTKLLQDKMNAIIMCYFQSQTPPRVQINIPYQIAGETVKKQFGPYVFRESQAIVFRNLQSAWSEYQNLLETQNKTSIEEIIGKMKLEITNQRVKMREEREQMKKEEERNKLSMPRFETIAEKKIRLKHEQELKEFGEVAVSFRLSHINPQFTYFFNNTTRTEECDRISDLSVTKKKKTVHYGIERETIPFRQPLPASNNYNIIKIN